MQPIWLTLPSERSSSSSSLWWWSKRPESIKLILDINSAQFTSQPSPPVLALQLLIEPFQVCKKYIVHVFTNYIFKKTFSGNMSSTAIFLTNKLSKFFFSGNTEFYSNEGLTLTSTLTSLPVHLIKIDVSKLMPKTHKAFSIWPIHRSTCFC